ncbi:MAG: HAD family phosphatase [Prevotella sp.]|nr:HAD family phosphatase [Prevotella sp.]
MIRPKSINPQFRAALFDLDGTLLDTEGQYSVFWGGIGREYHPAIADFAQRIKGTTMVNILATYFPDRDLQKSIIARIEQFEKTMDFPLVAGAEKFVKSLKTKGVKCAVVTSSDKSKMANVQRALPQFLALFDAILTAEDFAASKPDPDCYLRAAQRLNESPANCIVFEDAPNGLRAAMNARMFTVGLATGFPSAQIAPLCNVVIPDFRAAHISVDCVGSPVFKSDAE